MGDVTEAGSPSTGPAAPSHPVTPPQDLDFTKVFPGLLFNITPAQVLKGRVEEVIEEYNAAMEASQARVERLGEVVRREAAAVVAGVQEAEERRQEELATRMGGTMEKLEGDLERIAEQEERLRTFASSLALFGKDLPM